EMAEKMLLGVGSRYGKSSQEYAMAGGSRRKSKRRSTTAIASSNISPSRLELFSASNGKPDEISNGTSPAPAAS
ncbi:MAG: hypothetical protein WCA35_08425, partial [Kovacikia sp.]